MKRHDRHIINIKEVKNNVLTTTDILATSYEDAINYLKLLKGNNIQIRIYNEDERLVYSKIINNATSESHGNHDGHGGHEGHEGHIYHAYHHNYITHEHYEDDVYL